MHILPTDPCPCHSGRIYRNCCECLHQGTLPKDALALMRSRYTAYALRHAEYIIKTTHPNNPSYQSNYDKWTEEILLFSDTMRFERLEIVSFIHGKDVAFVTFIAHLKHNYRDATFKEKSRFEKVDGRWLYHSAQIC